ncbi:MAG: amidohydrolase family protein [Proteobacteria bacterium]|nr:amidohydrolase family protein [Pseudomonadota bacterium]
MKLASGIAQLPELIAAGVSVALGADGAACGNNLDGFLEMRLAGLLHKPRSGPRTLPAPEVVRIATQNGANALGLGAVIGSLQVGKRADVIAVDVRTLHTIPTANPWSAIAYAAQSRDVRHVAVDGKLVVRDGKLLTLDVDRVRREARAAATRLFS